MRVLSLALLLDGCCSDDTNGATGHDTGDDTGQGLSTLRVTNNSSRSLIALIQHDSNSNYFYWLIEEDDSIGEGETKTYTIVAGAPWVTVFANDVRNCGTSDPYTLKDGEEYNLTLSNSDFTGVLILETCDDDDDTDYDY